MDDRELFHSQQMAARQNVFPLSGPAPPPHAPATASQLSLPPVGLNPVVRERFWRRIHSVSWHYHDEDKIWIGTEELKSWNHANHRPCDRCINSQNGRSCAINENTTTCGRCREQKVACDRTTKFLFDMTKDEFFPTYEEFLRAYQTGEKPVSRGKNRSRSRRRMSPKNNNVPPTPRRQSRALNVALNHSETPGRPIERPIELHVARPPDNRAGDPANEGHRIDPERLVEYVEPPRGNGELDPADSRGHRIVLLLGTIFTSLQLVVLELKSPNQDQLRDFWRELADGPP
ncbi:hypothetical protein C8R46DRAFT_1107968 [Mycena filopes]|nr:hypothetical protein C8R46DRAFT_1107968 [Mycena filopes]